MNDLTIKNATEEQCKVLIQQANDRLAELAKPKQYVFKDGDFRWSSQHYRYVWDGSPSHFNWLESFMTLSYHCLKLGGRVMSKPNDGKDWYCPTYEYDNKKFNFNLRATFTEGLFNFPSDKLLKQFLSTEGVESHLLNFFQIEQ